MPKRVVQQPNGKLAIFSTIVDDFTHMDCDDAEAIAFLCNDYDYGKQEAARAVERGRRDEDAGRQPRSGLCRWNDDLKTVRIVHGEKKYERRLRVGKGEAQEGDFE